MKTIKRILTTVLAIAISFFTLQVSAKVLHNETLTFKVYGNCEMCKKRIETALSKSTAIKSAIWDVKTKMVTVVYDPHVISIEQIHQLIADAGHDTDKIKASDAVYNKLPVCCKYDRRK
ncbi:MAG: heavy-metal-associated domain-containing protein [Cytophagaceae bacterium]